jgi:hypothetical protein
MAGPRSTDQNRRDALFLQHPAHGQSNHRIARLGALLAQPLNNSELLIGK